MPFIRRSMGAAVAAAIACGAHAEVIYVDDDAPAGGDGSSWATPFKYLRDALAAATPGTEIRVAQGTYRPDVDDAGNVTPGDQEATFQLVNAVAVKGGFAGIGAPDPNDRDIDAYETKLSGDLLSNDLPDDFPAGPSFSDNSYHVVTASQTDDTAVLDGVTITAGNSNAYGGGAFNQGGNAEFRMCTFTRNSADHDGGAVRNEEGASPTFTACVFSENFADDRAGAVQNAGAGHVTFVDCTVSGNIAKDAGAISASSTELTLSHCQFLSNANDYYQGLGSVFLLSGSTLIATDCLFSDNNGPETAIFCGTNGADLSFANCQFTNNIGGVLQIAVGTLAFTDCQFTDNTNSDNGGVLRIGTEDGVSITNCTFCGNSSLDWGGAIYIDTTNTTEQILVEHCHFEQNSAESGGAIYLGGQGNILRVSHTAFVQNASSYYGGAVYSDGGTAEYTDCEFALNTAPSQGGALVFDSGAGFVERCTFDSNTAGRGAGADVRYAGAPIWFADCTFTDNTATDFGGGGMYTTRTMTISGCVFAGNTATGSTSDGGAIRFNGGIVHMESCTLVDNAAGRRGGGVRQDSPVDYVGCEFLNNTAGDEGGGLYIHNETPDIGNCLFGGNVAQDRGGGIFNIGSSSTIWNCTMVSNSAAVAGGGFCSQGSSSSPQVDNCILWANSDPSGETEAAQLLDVYDSATAVNYSCIQGLTGDLGGVGNIGDAPQFLNPDNGDFRLSSDSPCIDAADNTAVPPGVTTDLDGNPRFLEIPEVPDTGNGDPPIVDMGAYESLGGGCLAITNLQTVCYGDGSTFTVNVEGLNVCTGGTTTATFTGSGGAAGEDFCATLIINTEQGGFCCSTQVCVPVPDCAPPGPAGDIDGDGVVDVQDLLALLAAWGPNPGDPADLDGDGEVGVADLLALLAVWS